MENWASTFTPRPLLFLNPTPTGSTEPQDLVLAEMQTVTLHMWGGLRIHTKLQAAGAQASVELSLLLPLQTVSSF